MFFPSAAQSSIFSNVFHPFTFQRPSGSYFESHDLFHFTYIKVASFTISPLLMSLIYIAPPPLPLLQLPHVCLRRVDLTPRRLLVPGPALSLLLLLVVLVLLGLAFPQRDERWVQLIQRDGRGVLHVLLQRVAARFMLLHAAAHVDHQQRHDGQGKHGAHNSRQCHAAAPRRYKLHREQSLLRGDVEAGGVDDRRRGRGGRGRGGGRVRG